MEELFRLYKSQILLYIESYTPAIYYASAFVLQRIDRTQLRFLPEICCTEARALLQFRFAPLESRRNIAVLGMLHRIVLGLAPPQAAALFLLIGAAVEHASRQRLRYWRPLHDRQISTAATFASTDVF